MDNHTVQTPDPDEADGDRVVGLLLRAAAEELAPLSAEDPTVVEGRLWATYDAFTIIEAAE